MQTSTHDQVGSRPAGVQDPGAEPEPMDEQERSREEMRMLVIGFAIGMSIGLIFLVYVVLSAAQLLS